MLFGNAIKIGAFNVICSMLWVSFSIPVALAKYNRNKIEATNAGNERSLVYA